MTWAGHLAVLGRRHRHGWGPMLGAGAHPERSFHWTLDHLWRYETVKDVLTKVKDSLAARTTRSSPTTSSRLP